MATNRQPQQNRPNLLTDRRHEAVRRRVIERVRAIKRIAEKTLDLNAAESMSVPCDCDTCEALRQIAEHATVVRDVLNKARPTK